uniref:(northern house mosquito) hypothetical protein n=1 Tax=Culex pipiens TaxID=7175 RepID=A0A8D8D260_CULPI
MQGQPLGRGHRVRPARGGSPHRRAFAALSGPSDARRGKYDGSGLEGTAGRAANVDHRSDRRDEQLCARREVHCDFRGAGRGRPVDHRDCVESVPGRVLYGREGTGRTVERGADTDQWGGGAETRPRRPRVLDREPCRRPAAHLWPRRGVHPGVHGAEGVRFGGAHVGVRGQRKH